MADPERLQRLEPRRVQQFAHFFKSYMSLASVVTAALPVPVTAIGLIPTYAVQTKYLSTYTSMFCFLCLGFVFYSRHQLAPRMFPGFIRAVRHADAAPEDRNVTDIIGEAFHDFDRAVSKLFVPILPLLLIAAALFCAAMYQDTLVLSLQQVMKGQIGQGVGEADVLKRTNLFDIPNRLRLDLYYVGMFVTAETAFIVMAIKEYLQDLLGLSDFTIMTGHRLFPGDDPEAVLLGDLIATSSAMTLPESRAGSEIDRPRMSETHSGV
jgi:hypothetical protein